MIPDEAVEAAARASWERVNSAPWGCSASEDLRRHIDQREYLEDARVMLEAAAPHLEKDAYNRGWGAGFRHTQEAMKYMGNHPNPTNV